MHKKRIDIDFVESLNSNQFKKVETFFETMPKLSHTINVINPIQIKIVKSKLRKLGRVFSDKYGTRGFVSYYKLNFAMMQHHKYSLTELENMIPWEREIYVSLYNNMLRKKNLKAQQERNG